MDEEEFEALIQPRPFGTENAKRADLQYRRSISLAATVWSKAGDDLRRQLLAPSPEIPSEFGLADFEELLRITEPLAAAMSRIASATEAIVIGTQRYTEWEARCEIIRRAIKHLENR